MQAMSPSELSWLWACLRTILKILENPFPCTTDADRWIPLYLLMWSVPPTSEQHSLFLNIKSKIQASDHADFLWLLFGMYRASTAPISATVYAGPYPIIITTSIQEENRPQFKHNRQCVCCNTGQRRNDNVESTTAKSITYNFVQHLTSLMFHQTFSFTSLKHSGSISKISTAPA